MKSEYELLKERKAMLEADMDRASKKLQSYPKGAMGLTPDYIKFSPAYQEDRKWFETAKKAVQSFNQTFLKKYRKEWRDECIKKRRM